MPVAKFYGMLCLGGGIRAGADLLTTPGPDLHLNLWEDTDGGIFLDLGLRIHKDYPCKKIHFYFPWKTVDKEPIDLTPQINTADAISAIFNESWEVTGFPSSASVVVNDPIAAKSVFQIVSPAPFWSVDEQADHYHRLTIDLEQLLTVSRLVAEDIYMRFRVRGVPKTFYSVEFSQRDRGLVSSWANNEFIDFRLNVRRGAPHGLETQVTRYISFAKVHLFLMRHRSRELVFEDAAFKTCRSLEDETFWASYSHFGSAQTPQDDKKRHDYIANSLGYQWSRKRGPLVPGGPAVGVHEFSILARFKRIESSIWLFLLLVVLLGAAGNALWDLFPQIGVILIKFGCRMLCN